MFESLKGLKAYRTGSKAQTFKPVCRQAGAQTVQTNFPISLTLKTRRCDFSPI
jgi:hypothetical protein